ncbi:MAG: DUF1905 domain-containing protein [Jatrophihabitantaceae bacterium]
MTFEFAGELWYWRGPAPYYFVKVPENGCRQLKAMSGEVSYGWGVIPATVRIGATEWTTSLLPKDGQYLVPIKALVRAAEELEDGDRVELRLTVAG